MDRIYLALAALVGGILVALAGLWESHEPFDARKFGATVIRALFAGVVFAFGYQLTSPLGVKDIFLALLSATTFEVATNRVAGALGNPQFPLPAVKIPSKGRYALGKKPAKKDDRNIKLARILKALPPIPDTYNVDKGIGLTIPTPTFANDQWGNCVIAARAHFTRRFEGFEQKKVIPITDDEVLKEYWKEGHANKWNRKPDNGLVMLDSLKEWRSKGWAAAGKTYTIYAFAEVDWKNHAEVKATIYLLNGIYVGLALPISAQAQFESGKDWEVVAGPDGRKGSWGGHAVDGNAYKDSPAPSEFDIAGYNAIGPVVITWGQLQQMTWGFWDVYVDECYAVVDNRDKFLKDSPVDIEKLDGYLHQLGAV